MLIRTGLLLAATAVAEIAGCYLPFLVLRRSGSWWLLAPAALSLVLFVWLLSLHPTGGARTYAAYGGVYIAVAILWLWVVEREIPNRWDLVGAAISVLGMAVIVLGHTRRPSP